MKIEVEHGEGQEVPYLAITEGGKIILVTKLTAGSNDMSGVLLQDPDGLSATGETSEYWDKRCFTSYTGKITLSNT